MNNLFTGIQKDVRAGNYASALFSVLIVIVLIAVPTLYFSIGKKTDKIDQIRVECAQQMRDQAVEYQKRMDSVVNVKDIQLSMASKELADFKDSYIAKLEKRNEESKVLVTNSKPIIKAVSAETKKAKETGKVLDSISKSLVQ